MLKQSLATLKVVSLALVLSFGLSYALAWTAPTATPPGANVAAPLNASATDQVKTGGITAGSLTTTGLTTTGTLRVTTGAGATKVLTSDASGNATWQAAAGGSDNLGNHTATQALNMAGNNITASGNGSATFGPNSTWGAYLDVGGNGKTTTNASVVTTNGNLHLDAKTGAFGTYLNWYGATGGTHVGNGAAGYGLLTASDVYSSAPTGGFWMSASKPHGKQRFTANGTWTAPAGVTKVWVTMTGGGGGGGGACTTQGGAGGAGGAGGTKTSEAFTVTPGATYTVNIGTAGTAGAQCNCNAVANGGNGGAASFGTLSVLGGTGGKGGGQGGAPGTDGPRSGMGGAIYGDTYGLRGVGEAAYCVGVATAGTTGFVFVEW